MLRDVVENFLDSVTEREFDGPLLAILAARGYEDVHFIHGAFEFGKDVIAKRTDPNTGARQQMVIQSKAGDLGQSEWRGVRPQLEECEYNTIAHPSFDERLPRVAVLATTGRLKGAAAADTAEYRKRVHARGLADFELWDRSDFTEWLCSDPSLGLAGSALEQELIAEVLAMLAGQATEPRLERYARTWLEEDVSCAAASLQAAILVNAAVRVQRLDLALAIAVHLVRAAQDRAEAAAYRPSARRLVAGLCAQIRDQMSPVLGDPLEVARIVRGPMAMVTYPVLSCRVAESMALGLAVALEGEAKEEVARFEEALTLAAEQPGASRPPSDLFASSVVATTVMLNSIDGRAARTFLRRVAQWTLDCYDDTRAGLGLASLDEDERITASRLLGGALTVGAPPQRSGSYLLTVILDLALHLGEHELYEAILDNALALQIAPESRRADEEKARWRRGGRDIWPHPRVNFERWERQIARPLLTSGAGGALALMLLASCRSRHYAGDWEHVAPGDG